MPSRLGIRFALEALFILAVAVAVGFAHLDWKWIILVMVGAWLLTALVELIAAKPRFLREWRSYVFQRRSEPAAATASGPATAEPAPAPGPTSPGIMAPPVAPEAAPELPASTTAAEAPAEDKRSLWKRLTKPRPRPAAAAGAAAAAGTAAPVMKPPEPLTRPAEPDRKAEPEPEPTPEPEPAAEPTPPPESAPKPEPELPPAATAASAAAAGGAAAAGAQGERRARYALEPLQPRPRRFVMPWRRREERERLGLAEQKREEQKSKNEQPPKQATPREGGLFGRGKKKEPAEQKSSKEP